MWVSQVAQRRTGLFNIGHRTCRKFGSVSCTESTAQGNYYELILTVKIETRYPVEASFGSEFLAICNHCGVVAAWSRKTLKFCDKFLRFFGKKRPLTVTFSIFCSESFHRLADRRCCVHISWNLAGGKSAKSALFTGQKKFRLPLKLLLLRGSRPKFARASPNNVLNVLPFRFHPNRLTYCGVTVERVNTANSRPKVNPIFGICCCFEPNNYVIVYVERIKRNVTYDCCST